MTAVEPGCVPAEMGLPAKEEPMDIGDDESKVFPAYLSSIDLPPLLEVCDRLSLLRCRKVGGVATMREASARPTTHGSLDESRRRLLGQVQQRGIVLQHCQLNRVKAIARGDETTNLPRISSMKTNSLRCSCRVGLSIGIVH